MIFRMFKVWLVLCAMCLIGGVVVTGDVLIVNWPEHVRLNVVIIAGLSSLLAALTPIIDDIKVKNN